MSELNDPHYDLAKTIPDMLLGFTVHTSCGEIQITDEEAKAFVTLMKKTIIKRIVKTINQSA